MLWSKCEISILDMSHSNHKLHQSLYRNKTTSLCYLWKRSHIRSFWSALFEVTCPDWWACDANIGLADRERAWELMLRANLIFEISTAIHRGGGCWPLCWQWWIITPSVYTSSMDENVVFQIIYSLLLPAVHRKHKKWNRAKLAANSCFSTHPLLYLIEYSS